MTDKKALEVLESWLRLAYQNADGTDEDSAELYEALQTIFNLINRQKAKIKALNTENKQLQSDVITANQYYEYTKEQLEKAIKISQRSNRRFKEAKKELQNAKSEVERLERHTEMYHEVRAEAVKEFAERLQDNADLKVINAFESSWVISQELIDNLVKEMVGAESG